MNSSHGMCRNEEQMRVEYPHTRGQRKLFKTVGDNIHKAGNRLIHIFIPNGQDSADFVTCAGDKVRSSRHLRTVDGWV